MTFLLTRDATTVFQEAIAHLRTCDPILGRIIERVGPFQMEFREPIFDTLVRSIVYQQLSGKVARVIFERLHAAAGGRITPESILKLRPARMRKLGLSQQKTNYIRDLARHTRDGTLDFATLPDLPDDEVIARLTAVKGIGIWTAQMFLMFALRRTNVLATGDLGIRNAIRRAYELAEIPKPTEVEVRGEPWHPYRTLACWYLWRSLDGPAEL